MALGIEARGYQPTERDRQELERRIAQAAQRNKREPANGDRRAGKRGELETLKVVEAVVRSRVSDPPAQERILQGARNRIAGWLERGAQMKPVDVAAVAAKLERGRDWYRAR